MASEEPASAERLIELGFSHYEARAYVGLLGQEPMTGYALSNLTGIPQPKVYETLRRLARKGAAVPIGGEPARYVALPPTQLLAQLETDFRRRLADAQVELMRSAERTGQGDFRVLPALTDWDEIEQAGIRLLDSARRHFYVSLNCDETAGVTEAIRRADDRGVEGDILQFGASTLSIRNGRAIRHLSTDGVVYRHHQARHLAVVADGSHVLWALAAGGTDWDAVRCDDSLVAAAVKGYIRHDMYVQQIATDFGSLLEDRYGPGLGALVRQPGPGGGATTGAKTPRRRRSA
jgi:sugar-specific transcriptional regulator TrmB